jgi:hypothetical protein
VVSDLFKGSVSSFDVENPNDSELQAKPSNVEDVVLPADRERIDITIKNNTRSIAKKMVTKL